MHQGSLGSRPATGITISSPDRAFCFGVAAVALLALAFLVPSRPLFPCVPCSVAPFVPLRSLFRRAVRSPASFVPSRRFLLLLQKNQILRRRPKLIRLKNLQIPFERVRVTPWGIGVVQTLPRHDAIATRGVGHLNGLYLALIDGGEHRRIEDACRH